MVEEIGVTVGIMLGEFIAYPLDNSLYELGTHTLLLYKSNSVRFRISNYFTVTIRPDA